MSSNTLTFAERELKILLDKVPDAIIKDFVPEILAICDKFGNSGQSGGSAPYTASALSQAIKSLCLQEPITEIYGDEDEWVDVSKMSDGENLYQNRRGSALFKNGDQSPYYLDAIVWVTEKGHGWSGVAYNENDEMIYSRQHIKSFPFVPKTFYIDVS